MAFSQTIALLFKSSGGETALLLAQLAPLSLCAIVGAALTLNFHVAQLNFRHKDT